MVFAMTDAMKDLADALNLTGQMLTGAKAGEWGQVNSLSTQRMEHLQDFFSNPVPSEITSEVEATILQLQSLDRQLMVLCDSEREQIGFQLRSLNQVKKGAAAYRANR
jgi:hypothetical protein